MIVTNTPALELSLTNLAYCSHSDVRKFPVPAYANVNDLFVLSLYAHDSLRDGYIALNSIQRRHARVSTGDAISVSRFVPPDNFNLALLTLELEFVKKGTKSEQVDAALLSQQLRRRFIGQVMTTGQRVLFEYHGNNYIFTVNQAAVEGQEKSNAPERGMISSDTYFVFEASNASGIKVVNQREATSSNIFRQKEFNLQSLGIGGLSAEFADIFRRAFASRVFPPHVTNKLGIKHVKGMLLYGPPGTGKTLMARQIGKMLNGREPKIVNGPEVLSKFVGETEKNVRDLFADAENDQRTRGDESDLHVIIFDEIDAICKSRGSTRDGTGVHDSIVNQLLTKIDGVESLNNVLLIGMTNRKDLLDEALLRPGRLEVQVEINLPDETGRLQILQIHTNKMKENSFLASDVRLQELAARTKNYSGAELEGVVKSAVSFALNRQLSLDDLTKPVDEESIKVTMDDFLKALQEIIPAFGASTDDLERCRLNGMVECGNRHTHIYQRAMLLVEQVKVSRGSPLVTCLLEGPSGSGKSALAATVGIDSDFFYVKIVSAESMIGLHESTKCAQIVKVFEDAYKSQLSIIILDDIERLLEYVAIGPRFSNLISQTLLVLLKRLPPKGKSILVIGTTSEVVFLDSIGICDAFSVTYHVPTLRTDDAKKAYGTLCWNKKNVGHLQSTTLVSDFIGISECFVRVERIPYSKRFHPVISQGIVNKFGESQWKYLMKEYEGKVLPPTDPEAVRAGSIAKRIIQALHSGLRLENECNVNGYGDGGTLIDCPKVVEKKSPKFIWKPATKHLNDMNWEVIVVDSNIYNAFYIPPGNILIHRGLLCSHKSDVEIALIIGHEVGHAVARHAAEDLAKGFIKSILSNNLLLEYQKRLYQRRELEADYIGLMLMASAGYDPQEAPKALEKFFNKEDENFSTLRAKLLRKTEVMEEALAIYNEVRAGCGVRSFV